MPKFAVVLTRTQTANITIEVSARDEDTAHHKVSEAVQKLQWDPDKIATAYHADWEEDADEIEITSVEEA